MTKRFHSICFDLGNTRTKVGYFHKDMLHPFKVEVINNVDFQIKNDWLNGAEYAIMSTIEHSICGDQIRKQIQPIELTHQLKFPFTIDYVNASTLGRDRLAGMAGVYKLGIQAPFLLIDAGTCITYDFVNEENTFVGGAISPGLTMRLDAMHHFTSSLPKIEDRYELNHNLYGRNTIDCMNQGASWGMIHEINGFIASFSLHSNIKVILTGGGSTDLAKYLENATFAEPNLILIGLNHLIQLNA